MINLMWAMDENWLVGNDDKLPWRIAADLKYFQKTTKDKTVLMGHETYLSMKGYYNNKPFPFKKVYVANLEQVSYNDATLVRDVIKFLKTCNKELFVIGGPTIYKLALPFANQLYITYVLDRYIGNVYFPKFDLSQYKVITYTTLDKLIFTKYERKN